MEELTLLAKNKHFRRQLYLWAKWGYPNLRDPAWVASRQLLEILPQPPTLRQEHRILANPDSNYSSVLSEYFVRLGKN